MKFNVNYAMYGYAEIEAKNEEEAWMASTSVKHDDIRWVKDGIDVLEVKEADEE